MRMCCYYHSLFRQHFTYTSFRGDRFRNYVNVSLGRSYNFLSSDQSKFQALTMNQMNAAKRVKYSPSNVAEYEKLYMDEHNKAMGYTPRDVLPISPTVKTALGLTIF